MHAAASACGRRRKTGKPRTNLASLPATLSSLAATPVTCVFSDRLDTTALFKVIFSTCCCEGIGTGTYSYRRQASFHLYCHHLPL